MAGWSGVHEIALTIPGLPHYGSVRLVDIPISLLIAIVTAAFVLAARRLGSLSFHRIGGRLPVLVAGGLGVGLCAVLFHEISGKPLGLVLFSGETGLGGILTQTSAAVVVGCLFAKATAYALSIGAGFRGGPVFPSLFLGVAVGVLMTITFSGFSITAGVAAGVAAAAAAALRTPFTGALLGALLVGLGGHEHDPAGDHRRRARLAHRAGGLGLGRSAARVASAPPAKRPSRHLTAGTLARDGRRGTPQDAPRPTPPGDPASPCGRAGGPRRGRRLLLAIVLSSSGGKDRSGDASAAAQPPPVAARTADAAVRRLLKQGKPVYCGGRNKPYVALTFDDGPGPSTAQAVRTLAALQVPATFFLIGKQVTPFRETVALEARDNAVGNHTFHHVQLTALSLVDAGHEIADTSKAITAITHQPVRLLRPPLGSRTFGVERSRAPKACSRCTGTSTFTTSRAPTPRRCWPRSTTTQSRARSSSCTRTRRRPSARWAPSSPPCAPSACARSPCPSSWPSTRPAPSSSPRARVGAGCPTRRRPAEVCSLLGFARSPTSSSAEGERPEVLIDLCRLEFMDSSGLRLILRAHVRAKQEGRRLRLIHSGGTIGRVLRITSLDRELDVAEHAPAVLQNRSTLRACARARRPCSWVRASPPNWRASPWPSSGSPSSPR